MNWFEWFLVIGVSIQFGGPLVKRLAQWNAKRADPSPELAQSFDVIFKLAGAGFMVWLWY